MRAVIATVAITLAASAAAHGYQLDASIVPQPVLRYYVGPADWRKPFVRVVKDLNARRVGVRLVRAKLPERASVQVGRLEKGCDLGGVEGTTQTLRGGFAAIYLPRGCHGVFASILAAHELGHALGLLHEDRRCALLNSSGTGSKGIPTRCLGRRFDWLRHPWRGDDLAGLRRLYRNTAPKATLALSDPSKQAVANQTVFFVVRASDREDNISELRIDWGDDSESTGYTAAELQRNHAYTTPGRYMVTLSVVDLYLRKATARVTLDVTG